MSRTRRIIYSLIVIALLVGICWGVWSVIVIGFKWNPIVTISIIVLLFVGVSVFVKWKPKYKGEAVKKTPTEESIDGMPIVSVPSTTYPKLIDKLSKEQVARMLKNSGFYYSISGETIKITLTNADLETTYVIVRTGSKSYAVVDEKRKYI